MIIKNNNIHYREFLNQKKIKEYKNHSYDTQELPLLMFLLGIFLIGCLSHTLSISGADRLYIILYHAIKRKL